MSIVSPLTRRRRGFTIVELLIVIVVIAILAAITIAVYTGIRERAINSQMVNEANQAVRLLKAYRAANDAYPAIASGASTVCVGEGFTNYVGDANGDCWDTIGSNYKSVDPGFNAALATVGRLSTSSKLTIPYAATASFTGPVFSTPTDLAANNPTGVYVVQYWVYGTTCPVGTKTWAGTTSAVSRCAIPTE